MAALTSLALAAGIGSAVFGGVEDFLGSNKQQQGLQEQQQGYQIEQQAASQQAAISKAQAAASVVAAGQERDIDIQAAQNSSAAALQSQGINRNIFNEQNQIQTLQKQAMEVQAHASNLQQIRNQQQARSVSLATGVAQGGSGYVGGSSARSGAYGGISGQSNTNLLTNQQALSTGEQTFAANAAITGYNLQMNDLQTQYALQQAATQTAKSNLTYSYAQQTAGFQTQLADTQTLMAQGQGLVSMGGGIASAGASQMQMGSTFLGAAGSIFSAGNNINQLMEGLPSFNFAFGGGSPSGYGTGYA